MSYSDGEALLLAVVRLHDDYTSQNSSRGNFHVLNSGKSEHYAILRPAEFESAPISLGGIGSGNNYTEHTTWRCVVQVWQRYKKDGVSATDLQARLSSLKAHLNKYRTIEDTTGRVLDFTVTGGGEMLQMPADAPQWLMWSINCEWIEENEVAPG